MTAVDTKHSKTLQPLWDNLRRWAKTRLVAKMVQDRHDENKRGFSRAPNGCKITRYRLPFIQYLAGWNRIAQKHQIPYGLVLAIVTYRQDHWWLNALNPNNYGPKWIAQNLVSKWELIEALLATLPPAEITAPDLVDLELRVHKIIDLQVHHDDD